MLRKTKYNKKALCYGALFMCMGFLVWWGLTKTDIGLMDHSGNTQGAAYHYTDDLHSIQKLLTQPNIKTTISRGEVVSGGVPKDGIQAIDEVRTADADSMPTWLEKDGDGIAFISDGHARFYPYQVLVRHEIVNDDVANKAILVTYCPLCYTGVVFNRTVQNQEITFGVSGVLHNSNLLMYNRSHPESLWAQASGEAVIGSATGQQLTILPFDITTLDAFVEAFPEGDIVIGGEGIDENIYTINPYGGNLRDPNVRFPTPGEKDDRLLPNDRVVGWVIDGHARAYHIPSVEGKAPFEEEIAGRIMRVDWDHDLGAVRVFDITGGQEERIAISASFWFSWVSTYPQTTLYK